MRVIIWIFTKLEILAEPKTSSTLYLQVEKMETEAAFLRHDLENMANKVKRAKETSEQQGRPIYLTVL